MKNLIYIFLFLTFVQCVNSSSPKKSNSNNEIKSEGFIELHNNDSLVLNCNDFIETELWRFIDSIDFHATSIPSKIAAYAYRDLRKSKYKNINDLIVYNINPSQHSAFEYFNSKDTLCISKIKGYYCKAKCISCKSVDCVIEIWDLDNKCKLNETIDRAFKFTYRHFYFKYIIIDSKIYLIHTRSNTFNHFVDEIYEKISYLHRQC